MFLKDVQTETQDFASHWKVIVSAGFGALIISEYIFYKLTFSYSKQDISCSAFNKNMQIVLDRLAFKQILDAHRCVTQDCWLLSDYWKVWLLYLH